MLRLRPLRLIRAAIFTLLICPVGCAKPVPRLAALNGCYEGEGLPDFMRPQVHWALRIHEGIISDRAGIEMSRVRATWTGSGLTSLRFSPGISLGDNEHKQLMVSTGDIVAGKAYLSGSAPTILLGDSNHWVLKRTSC